MAKNLVASMGLFAMHQGLDLHGYSACMLSQIGDRQATPSSNKSAGHYYRLLCVVVHVDEVGCLYHGTEPAEFSCCTRIVVL